MHRKILFENQHCEIGIICDDELVSLYIESKGRKETISLYHDEFEEAYEFFKNTKEAKKSEGDTRKSIPVVKEGERAVLIAPIQDYENGFFVDVGTCVDVEEVIVDPSMPTGYSAKIVFKNANRTYYIDKSCLIHIDAWSRIKEHLLSKRG